MRVAPFRRRGARNGVLKKRRHLRRNRKHGGEAEQNRLNLLPPNIATTPVGSKAGIKSQSTEALPALEHRRKLNAAAVLTRIPPSASEQPNETRKRRRSPIQGKPLRKRRREAS